MAKVLEVKDLVKRYGDLVAVDHMDLSINEGEIFGLLGPNGSGKSTFIHSILSILKIDHGDIRLFGQPMRPDARDLKARIGFVPQDVAVLPELKVYENIDYFCGMYIADKAKRKELVEKAIVFAGLQDFRKFLPKQLSGGLLRRLNLACGIAHEPDFIVFDEPTVAVDPQSRRHILESIKGLADKGATVLYTTHYMEEVEMLCDRLAIIDKGKVLVEGTSQEIINMSSLASSVKIQSFDLPKAVQENLAVRPGVSEFKYSDGWLSLKLKGADTHLLDILEVLKQANCPVLSISSERPTLNDVFLEITGKELRDHA